MKTELLDILGNVQKNNTQFLLSKILIFDKTCQCFSI